MRIVLLAVTLGFLALDIAHAQRGRDASLIGTVTDASGAPLPGATVIASSAQHIGGPQATVTDAEGHYRFPLLSPGSYDIRISLPAFKTVEQDEVILPPGITLAVDAQLAIAPVAETVAVEGRAAPIDVRSSGSPTLIDAPLLDNLPLDRNVTGYINLVPGVTRNVGFGGSASANPISLDGASGNEPGWGTPTTPLTRAWIEEIQVVGPGAPAQYGEFTGALFNALSRSGTNHFAGRGEFWTTRHNWTGNNRGALTPALASQFRPLEVLTRWEGTVDAGGPILQDRLWYFAGAQRYRNDIRPAAFSTLPRRADEPQSTITEQREIAKLTASLTPSMRVDGFVSHNALDGFGNNAGPLVTADALSASDRTDEIWNARLQWTLGPQRLFEAATGGNRNRGVYGPPRDRRSGPPAHFDLFTNVTSGNAPFINDYRSRVMTVTAALTQYVDHAKWQRHELRFGGEYEHATIATFSGIAGNRLFYDYEGAPYQVQLWDGQTYRGRHSRSTFYAQDSWLAAPRLTVNGGLRVDSYRSAPPYEADYSTHSVAPRIGVAWDVTGTHRSVVRAHYGRYYDPIVSSYYDFLDPLSNTPDITAEVVGPNEFRELYRFLGTTGFAIDPDIKASYAEEFLAAYEQSVGARIALKAQYIERHFEDTVSFIDTATRWQPVQILDPGPDNRRGTADDAGLITVFNNSNPGEAFRVMTNPPQAYRRYRAAQVVASRRHANGWGFQASYTWSRTVGNYHNGFSSNAANNDNSINGVFVNPNRAINSEGRTPQDVPHALKVFGSVRLPWLSGWTASGSYRYQTGPRWSRLVVFTSGLQQGFEFVRVEPLTRTTPALHTADLRLEKNLQIQALSFGLFADVFNVTNAGTPRGYVHASGPRFGLPQAWIDPRTLRVGLRAAF